MHSRSAAGRRSDEPEDDRLHLAQFAMPAADHLPAQLLVLGMVIALIALVVDSVWALAAGTVSQWLSSSPRRLAAADGAGGIAMIGIGDSLAVTGRKG